MLHLLPREALVRTGPVDHADWNYRGWLGIIQRLRFRLVRGLLPSRKGRLLEIGYGSGVFMPELARHFDELYGIDIHDRNADVADVLRQHGVTADLRQASAEALPFDDASFDCLVAVSSLEFIPDPALAAREMRRVLKPTGSLVLVTPGHSPLVDWGLKVLTGESASRDYSDRRAKLLPTLLTEFRQERVRKFPALIHPLVCLYRAYRLIPSPAG